jgi:hypothetical protein
LGDGDDDVQTNKVEVARSFTLVISAEFDQCLIGSFVVDGYSN